MKNLALLLALTFSINSHANMLDYMAAILNDSHVKATVQQLQNDDSATHLKGLKYLFSNRRIDGPHHFALTFDRYDAETKRHLKCEVRTSVSAVGSGVRGVHVDDQIECK